MKAKKIWALLMALAMVFSLAACGDTAEDTSDADNADAENTDTAEASDLAYVQDKGTLVVGITEFEPMDYQNESGEWVGFDADLAKEFAESLGVEAQFQIIDWDSKIMELDGKTILPLQFAMSRDAAVLRASHETAASAVRPFLDAGQDVAMLNLGDVSIYATFGYLQEILQAQGYATAMAAGVPSFCAAAARLNQPLTGGMDAPLTIAPGSRADEVLDAPGTKVLMKTGRQLPALLNTLDAHGALSRSALVCSCGLPDETIFPDLSTARPPQDGSKAGYFATVLVKE